MPVTAAAPFTWHTARGPVPLDRPVIMGILNSTPDSFWDGGRHVGVEAAVRHAAVLVQEGADIIDVGGESTRPGATRVSEHVEIARIVPIVRALTARWPGVHVSVDTTKAAVARAALEAGAAIVNDVSALRFDRELGAVVAAADAGVILMHSRGAVEDMARYDLADYSADPVADIVRELGAAVERARAAGIAAHAIVVDPGLGFAKRTTHSVAALAGVDRLAGLGLPVLVGPSRKRFIGEAAGGSLPARDRLEGTLAACVIALLRGATLFRVHDVAAARRALDFAHAATAPRKH